MVYCCYNYIGDIAHQVERLFCTQKAAGSSPVISTISHQGSKLDGGPNFIWPCNSVVRVPPCQGGSRGFNSLHGRGSRLPRIQPKLSSSLSSYGIDRALCECSLMVEFLPSKQIMPVRFRSLVRCLAVPIQLLLG